MTLVLNLTILISLYMSDSKKEKMLMAKGVVTEALPNTLFRVKINDKTEGEKEILSKLYWILMAARAE